MNKRLKLSSSVKKVRRDDKVLFINPDPPSWLVTNRNGEIAIELCNGRRSIEQIAILFGKRYGTEQIPQITRFLSGIENSDIFSRASSSSCASKCQLRILQLSLTSECNLHCSYCYASDRPKSCDSMLALAEYRQIINDACSISSDLQVVLTGGEPLLNPDYQDIAKYAKDHGCKVHLLTNGTLINEANAQSIAQLFFLVKLSVDGSTREKHEQYRGHASYDPLMKAISLLETTGANYQVSMTVTKTNIADIEAMAKRYGSRLTFSPVFNAGRAKELSIGITGSQYYAALASVPGVNPLSELESALANANREKILKCAVGDAELSISETGDVYPCQLLHNERFYAGNVRRESLIEIYSKSSVIKECRELTVDKIKGCKSCCIRYICGGACRARSFYECGEVCVSGKFCEYEKLAFINGIFNLYSKNALQY